VGLAGAGVYLLFAEWLSLAWLLLISAGLLGVGLPAFLRDSDLGWSENFEEVVLRKIEQPGYQVEIRLAACAGGRDRVVQILQTLIGAFRGFSLEVGNSFCPLAGSPPFRLTEMDAHRGAVNILGDAELATLWHLPVDVLPDMMAVKKYTHRTADTRAFHTGGASWLIGHSGKSGSRQAIRLPIATLSSQNAFLLGTTGSGKTTTLEHMIATVAGLGDRGVVVIDPHGDMVRRLLGLIPRERVKDAIYLDFADQDRVPGINLLDVDLFGGDPEVTAAAFTETARSLYGKFWGPRMEVPFKRANLALALANTMRPPQMQFTVLDAIDMILMKGEQRRNFLSQVLPEGHLLTKTLINYFSLEFDTRSPTFREQVISPVLSKLRPFEEKTALMAVFGQPRSTIDLLQAIRAGKLVLVRSGMEKFGEDYSNFIGSVVLNLAQKAILSQEDLAPEERTRITVVVDESQLFSGFDFGNALAMLRKFGGNFFLTSQGESFLGRARSSDEQDRPNAFRQVMANVNTRIVFRLGGHDARVLTSTDFFGEMDPPNLINLPDYHAFLQFTANEHVHGPILVETLPPRACDQGVSAEILARRAAYTLPLEEALAAASRVVDRVAAFYSTEEAGRGAQYEERMTPVPGQRPPSSIPASAREVLAAKAQLDASEAQGGAPGPVLPRNGLEALQRGVRPDGRTNFEGLVD
jgi:hypothetical protein